MRREIHPLTEMNFAPYKYGGEIRLPDATDLLVGCHNDLCEKTKECRRFLQHKTLPFKADYKPCVGHAKCLYFIKEQ